MSDYQPKYVAPRGPGRPPKRADLEIPIKEFWTGVDTFFDSTSIDGPTRLCFNTRNFEGSSLDRRLGSALRGSAGDVGSVYGQMVLQQSNGSDIHLRLVDGAGAGVQLQKWNGSSWENLGSNIGTSDDRVDWSWTYVQIGGEDRVYFTNGVSDLRYTNGTTVSTVADTKGKYITTKENILILGCMKDIYPENAFVWSKADSHQFYLDNEDYATSSLVAYVDGPITGVKSFNWLIYTFTEADGLFETDISSSPAPRKISTHGTMAPKSIAVGFDCMIWADQYRIWQLPIGGDVMPISKSIDKVYKEITAANFFTMAGGMNANEQYELHVGDLTFEGVAYENVTFIYEIEQSRFNGKNIWRIDTDKIFANNLVTVADEYGFFNTYYGSRTNQSVYQTDVGSQDSGSNIAMTWISKDFPIVSENNESTVGDIYIRYTPLGADEIPVTLYVRKDTETWQDMGTFNLPVGSSSIKMQRIPGLKGVTGRTAAVKLVSTSNLATSIKQILITYSYNESQLPTLAPEP